MGSYTQLILEVDIEIPENIKTVLTTMIEPLDLDELK